MLYHFKSDNYESNRNRRLAALCPAAKATGASPSSVAGGHAAAAAAEHLGSLLC